MYFNLSNNRLMFQQKRMDALFDVALWCYKVKFHREKTALLDSHFDWEVNKDWSLCSSKREVVLFPGHFAICSFCKENAFVSVILSEMPLL